MFRPFGGDSFEDVYAAALETTPFFPRNQFLISDCARELISSLLSRRPEARPTAAQVLEHAFFTKEGFRNADALDAAALRRRELPPPFVPRLRSAVDASHFEGGSGSEGGSDSGGEGTSEDLAAARPAAAAAAPEVTAKVEDAIGKGWPATALASAEAQSAQMCPLAETASQSFLDVLSEMSEHA